MLERRKKVDGIPEALRSAKETARILGVSLATVSRLVQRQELGCYRIAERRLFSDQQISDYLKRTESRPLAPEAKSGG